MAYDRYDTHRSRDDRHSSDRGRGDPRGTNHDRGFFERAGEEIKSWFGDDDDNRHRDDRDRDHGRHRPAFGDDRARGDDRENPAMHSDRAYDRGYGRDYDRDHRGSSGSDRDYQPMTGDYAREGRGPGRDEGRDPRSEYERDQYRRTSYAGSSAPNDPHYHAWKRRQMEELDRDYDDYRREHQSKFESEFGGWREKRQSKRQMLGQVREHMDVVGNDGEHVGTVDCVKDDRIVLTKSDPDSGGIHHSLGCGDLDRVEDNKVVLDCSADKAREKWRDEGRNRALFEPEDQGEDGPHVLGRSFSGTYR